jgi:hypothetical protein
MDKLLGKSAKTSADVCYNVDRTAPVTLSFPEARGAGAFDAALFANTVYRMNCRADGSQSHAAREERRAWQRLVRVLAMMNNPLAPIKSRRQLESLLRRDPPPPFWQDDAQWIALYCIARRFLSRFRKHTHASRNPAATKTRYRPS